MHGAALQFYLAAPLFAGNVCHEGFLGSLKGSDHQRRKISTLETVFRGLKAIFRAVMYHGSGLGSLKGNDHQRRKIFTLETGFRGLKAICSTVMYHGSGLGSFFHLVKHVEQQRCTYPGVSTAAAAAAAAAFLCGS